MSVIGKEDAYFLLFLLEYQTRHGTFNILKEQKKNKDQ